MRSMSRNFSLYNYICIFQVEQRQTVEDRVEEQVVAEQMRSGADAARPNRPSFRKRSKINVSTCIYLNIRPMRYSAMQNIKAQRAKVTGSMNWHNNVEPPM